MSRFNRRKFAVTLLGALAFGANDASAMNSGIKNSGNLATKSSGNISINNSNNNGDAGWVKNHKWQLGIGGLSVATVVTLAIVGGKYLIKKDDDKGKPPNPDKDKKKNDDKKKEKEKEKEKEKSEDVPKGNEFITANKNSIDNAFQVCNGASDFRPYFDTVVNAVVSGKLDGALKEHADSIKGALSGNLEMKKVSCQLTNGECNFLFEVNNVQYGIICGQIGFGFVFFDSTWISICGSKWSK